MTSLDAERTQEPAFPEIGEAFLERFLEALRFAAEKHRSQRRKGGEHSPYINHPIEVVHILWKAGGVRTPEVLIAALLHDTLEDTDTRSEEIAARFGDEVLALVEEVSDDKSLPQAVRKRLQIEHAAQNSAGAKLIKLADKIHNVRSLCDHPPVTWSEERVLRYVDWSEAVVAGLRGVNAELEAAFDRAAARVREFKDACS